MLLDLVESSFVPTVKLFSVLFSFTSSSSRAGRNYLDRSRRLFFGCRTVFVEKVDLRRAIILSHNNEPVFVTVESEKEKKKKKKKMADLAITRKEEIVSKLECDAKKKRF